jgi:hypothetical protein
MAKLTVDNVLSAFIMELETNSLNVNHNWPEIVYCMESIDANRALSKYSEETIKTARVIIKYYDGLLAIKGVFGCYLGKFNPFEPFKMNKKRPRRINHVINNCCFFDNALMIPNGTKGFIEYWEKYGTEGFFKSLIINGLAKQSRQIGIMEIFGRFPEENMTFCITKSFNGRPQAEIDEAIADGLKALNDIENGNYK